MSRKILVLSAVLIIAAMGLLVYTDPLARLSLGRSPTFTGLNSTRTFTFGNSSFTFTPGSVPGGLNRGSADTNGQIETLIAIAVAAVGLILEFVAIFLYQDGNKLSSRPGGVAPT